MRALLDHQIGEKVLFKKKNGKEVRRRKGCCDIKDRLPGKIKTFRHSQLPILSIVNNIALKLKSDYKTWFYPEALEDKHCITIRKKSVFLPEGLSREGLCVSQSDKRGDKHKKCRFRQVKVRE